MQVSESDDLDADAFFVSEVPALFDIEALGDAAIEALGFDDAHIESITATQVVGAPAIMVSVESPRARGLATFDGAGTLREARRS